MAYAVLDPIETNVDDFTALLFDSVVGNTSCSAVVALLYGAV